MSLIMLFMHLVKLAKDGSLLFFVEILESLEELKLEFTKALSVSWSDRGTLRLRFSLTY